MRSDLPSGTVTFLFTDIEGSTRLLHELGPEAYLDALAEHRRLMRAAFGPHEGYEVDYEGDAFFVAFQSAAEAVAAAAEAQEALAGGPIRVRMGLHTGEPLLDPPKYVGVEVHRAARIMAAGHGGQILLSSETASLLDGAALTSLLDGAALTSLGSHRLKDFAEPVTIYQLGEGSFPRLKTIANSNLPTPASSFLGRETELYEADELLQQSRLLTVSGPGGAGKTRFALELATRAREERFSDYEDGVYSAFLSSLRDHELVPAAIAVALGVTEQPGQTAFEALSSHLQGKRMLVMLDNLEHLLKASRELSELLSACPGLTILCTSRERLRLQGERVYALPPLSDSESVSLFCERAQTEPDEDTRELCARLEGLPLAIELAAARAFGLSARQIVTRLSQRLDLLKGGPDSDPRQETLRATIQWSYELLSTEEQRLFARLSVFQGGCTLDAAEEVCEADIDTLLSLVDKSLLRLTADRYWLLETIKEFAAEKLEESDQLESTRERHLGYVLELVAKLEATFASDAERTRFSHELDNFRTALAWAESAGHASAQLDLLGRSWPFWWVRGDPFEGLAWVESALPSASRRDARRVKVLCAGAMFAYRALDLQRVRAYADEGLAIARGLAEPGTAIWPLIFTGLWAFENADFSTSRSRYQEALELARETGAQRLAGIAENNLGVVAEEERDLVGAIVHFDAALAISRSLGPLDETPLEAINLARCLYRTGRPAESFRVAREGLGLAQATDNFRSLANGVALLAVVAGERGDTHAAARLLGAAAELEGRTLDAEYRDEWSDASAQSVRSALGDQRYAECLAEGRAMSVDDAVAYALETVGA